ncbi:hypothetical protein pb186bvf_009886 [Paramecium bursaria]
MRFYNYVCDWGTLKYIFMMIQQFIQKDIYQKSSQQEYIYIFLYKIEYFIPDTFLLKIFFSQFFPQYGQFIIMQIQSQTIDIQQCWFAKKIQFILIFKISQFSILSQ